MSRSVVLEIPAVGVVFGIPGGEEADKETVTAVVRKSGQYYKRGGIEVVGCGGGQSGSGADP